MNLTLRQIVAGRNKCNRTNCVWGVLSSTSIAHCRLRLSWKTTSSYEECTASMKLIDANVLIYAVNPDDAHHEASRTWLDQALSGSEPLASPGLRS